MIPIALLYYYYGNKEQIGFSTILITIHSISMIDNSLFSFQIEHLPRGSATMAGTTTSPTRTGGQLVSSRHVTLT